MDGLTKWPSEGGGGGLIMVRYTQKSAWYGDISRAARLPSNDENSVGKLYLSF